MQHVDVAVQIVEKLDQLIKKFYTGSKLESNSIFIQYLFAKVTDTNVGQKLPIILLCCFSVNTNVLLFFQCETIVLKLKCLHLDIVNATYTKESIRAIR